MLEQEIETQLIRRQTDDLKYVYHPEIRDLAALEANFRIRFEELNCVRLSDAEFSRLLDMVVSGDVYRASCTLRERQTLERDDGTPLICTLVNTKDFFQRLLHAYTITNAIEDRNVLRFHADYFRPEGADAPRAVVRAILAKHDGITAERKFDARSAAATARHNAFLRELGLPEIG
ncbi:hypothetical protein [uncultured Mailhella sp.]|uniref:hypothetical protein n=1 Tax=uncultured Mailhella sp. TaxID=1981031 RepID=UPI002616BE6B|nr:hypothetical protein [uncultured Mailhella sp.]